MSTDSYWPRVNGATVSIDTFRTQLAKMGHRADLVAPSYPTQTQVGTPDDPGILRLPSSTFIFSPEDRLVNRKSGRTLLAARMDELKPHILHAQTEFSSFNLMREFARSRKLPLVMTSHTYWEQYFNNYIPFFPSGLGRQAAKIIMQTQFRHADLIITPSHHMKDVLERYRITPAKVVIPTGIDPVDMEGASRNRKENPLGQAHPEWANRRILLFAGRISQEKNVDFLVSLVAALAPRYPDILVLMVGDGPQRVSLEHQITQKGLGGNFHFSGYVPRREIRHWYAMADVFVFPSKSETQGLVTIEAMMCGTPVVAIGEMGTREVMDGDNGGFMVGDNLEEFAHRVEALLGDQEVWKTKSDHAYTYSRGWTIEAQAAKLVKAYRSLI